MVGLALAFIFFIGLLVFSGLNEGLGRADIGLLLGNHVSPDGTPSARLQARLDRAAEPYREAWFPLIVVSGVTGVEGFPEGTAMKNDLVSVGIPADAIIVDGLGFDIRASARNTARILQDA
jgi:vancomycin permeability regulator SanA